MGLELANSANWDCERRVRQKREIFSYDKLGQPRGGNEEDDSETRVDGQQTSNRRQRKQEGTAGQRPSRMPKAGDLSAKEALDFWLHPDPADVIEGIEDDSWAVVKTVKLPESFESWFVSRDCFDGCTTTEIITWCNNYNDAVRLARSVRDADERFDDVERHPENPPFYSEICVPGDDKEDCDEVVIVTVERYVHFARRMALKSNFTAS